MDEYVVELIRDQFKAVHDKIDAIHSDMREHVEKDERYWSKIDAHQGQLSLIRWLFSGASGTAILAWLHSRFGGH